MEIVIRFKQIFSVSILNDDDFILKYPNANLQNISSGFRVLNHIENNDLATFQALVFDDLKHIISRVYDIDLKTIEIAIDKDSGFARALYGISINYSPELIVSIL